MDAFRSADEVLLSGVQGITDLITTPGLINLDFADVKSVMSGAGSALMGIGSARGEGRAVQAAEKAINSPLLEASMDGAHGVLLSIAGGSDLGLFEINEAASLVQEAAHPEANIIFGTVIDDSLGDEVRVTVIAAGFDSRAGLTHKKTGSRGLRRANAQRGSSGSGVIAAGVSGTTSSAPVQQHPAPTVAQPPATPPPAAGTGTGPGPPAGCNTGSTHGPGPAPGHSHLHAAGAAPARLRGSAAEQTQQLRRTAGTPPPVVPERAAAVQPRSRWSRSIRRRRGRAAVHEA